MSRVRDNIRDQKVVFLLAPFVGISSQRHVQALFTQVRRLGFGKN